MFESQKQCDEINRDSSSNRKKIAIKYLQTHNYVNWNLLKLYGGGAPCHAILIYGYGSLVCVFNSRALLSISRNNNRFCVSCTDALFYRFDLVYFLSLRFSPQNISNTRFVRSIGKRKILKKKHRNQIAWERNRWNAIEWEEEEDN